MRTPPIVTTQEWEAARERLLVKEKEVTRAKDALAAERRRMPWLEVPKDYVFEGPDGKASLPERAPHRARTAGGVGGLAGGLPAVTALRLMELARRVRQRSAGLR
jgi:hypothetical protein